MLKIFSKELKGFTLIELLVVIAIIALLASIASVVAMEAQKKGRDAGIQANLTQVRFEAALIKNRDESYEALCCAVAPCNPDTLNDANDNLRIIEDKVRKYSGSDPICYASENSYCVQSPLVRGGNYCIDSTGYAGTTANCATGNTKCTP